MAGDFQSAVWIKQDMFNMLVVWSVLLVAVAAGPIRSRLREFAALKRAHRAGGDPSGPAGRAPRQCSARGDGGGGARRRTPAAAPEPAARAARAAAEADREPQRPRSAAAAAGAPQPARQAAEERGARAARAAEAAAEAARRPRSPRGAAAPAGAPQSEEASAPPAAPVPPAARAACVAPRGAAGARAADAAPAQRPAAAGARAAARARSQPARPARVLPAPAAPSAAPTARAAAAAAPTARAPAAPSAAPAREAGSRPGCRGQEVPAAPVAPATASGLAPEPPQEAPAVPCALTAGAAAPARRGRWRAEAAAVDVAAAPAAACGGSAGPAGGRGAPGALGGLVPCPFAACGWRGPAAAYAGHVAACGLRRSPCGGAAGLHEPDELPAAPRPVPQGAAGAAEAAAPAGGPRGGRRAEAARRAFRALDVDCKGYLTSDELKTFAGMSGFDGTDADWQVEFGTLCRQWRRSPAEGIDQPFFCAIVDDASERGVYCTDEELAGIHQRLVADRLVRGARAPGDRADAAAAEVRVARLLFQLLDLDGDGRLCAEELRPLAILTGFEGDDEEWAAEYALLCQERRCEAGRGLPLTAYLDMVGDRSGGGCFCSAALLRLFAEELAHGLAARGGVAAAAAPRA